MAPSAAILLVDLNGEVLEHNPEAAALFVLRTRPGATRSVHALVAPNHALERREVVQLRRHRAQRVRVAGLASARHQGVDVHVRPAPAGGVAFSVADTGRGMDSVQLADIFQPFKRLGAQTSGTEGSGMSLFVSRRVVEPMGGSSIVDSGPGAGTGTVFTVSLPAAPGR